MDPREERKPAGRSGAAAWAVAAGIGAVIWLAVMATRGGFTETDRTLFLHILSDAFFVPGVLLASVGLLIFVAAGGVFDMLSYGVQKVLHLFRFGKGEDTFPKTYFEYKQIKEGKRTRRHMGVLLVTGAAFLAAAGIVLYFYYRG